MLRLMSAFFLLLPPAATAGEIPVEDFARRADFHHAVLSPGGDYIAVERSAEEGKKLVAIVSTSDLSLLGHIPAGSDFSPFSPVWANDERLIVRLTRDREDAEFEVANGELISIDYDGGKQRRLIEHQVAISGYRDTQPLNALHGAASVVHQLPSEKDHVLIRFREFEQGREYRPTVYRIHVTRGRLQRIADAPTYFASFVFSPSGELLYSIGVDGASMEVGENIWVVHRFDDGDWVQISDLDIGDAVDFEIIASAGDSAVYMNLNYADRPDRVVRYDLASNVSELVFAHAEVDPSGFDFDAQTGELIAVHFEAPYPDIHLVDPDHVYSQWYPALFQAFGGNRVRITSASDDGRLLLVHVSGDREPGQFRLFDTATKDMKYLFNAAPWIDADQMAEMLPVSVEARDGLKLHGFLTLPNGADGAVPLVVMPHGGPYGVRDTWRFNRNVQFLASRGYGVLQINFRGSGGYGLAFREAGYRAWGRAIQHDIIDATQWAASLEQVDPERICIVGSSFGAYSAMMAPMLAPDLYKCAVGLAGVYDLELMWSTADIERTRYGENYLELAIGSDPETLESFSPARNVERLEIPVFLAHGNKDWRADVKHFEKMTRALKDADHPHETLLVKGEGHGFFDEANRTKYLRKLESFLGKHIGSGPGR